MMLELSSSTTFSLCDVCAPGIDEALIKKILHKLYWQILKKYLPKQNVHLCVFPSTSAVHIVEVGLSRCGAGGAFYFGQIAEPLEGFCCRHILCTRV